MSEGEKSSQALFSSLLSRIRWCSVCLPRCIRVNLSQRQCSVVSDFGCECLACHVSRYECLKFRRWHGGFLVRPLDGKCHSIIPDFCVRAYSSGASRSARISVSTSRSVSLCALYIMMRSGTFSGASRGSAIVLVCARIHAVLGWSAAVTIRPLYNLWCVLRVGS